MVKLIESQGRFNVTIPTDLIKRKKWKKGRELLLRLNEKGNIEMEEI